MEYFIVLYHIYICINIYHIIYIHNIKMSYLMRTWYRLARFDPIMFQLPFRMKNPCALVASKLQTARCHPEFYADV